jgi:hypothetical protein
MHARIALVYMDVNNLQAAGECLRTALELRGVHKDHSLNAGCAKVRIRRRQGGCRNAPAEREAGLPQFCDSSDPNSPVILLYQSFFLNAIRSAHDTRVSDALAGAPLETYRRFGESSELDSSLCQWAESFGINFDFVISAAKRTLNQWSANPEALAKRRWSLSRAGEWTVANRKLSIDDKLIYLDPEIDPPEVLDTKYRQFRARQQELLLNAKGVKPVEPKKRRDVRDRFIAFEFLVLRHVFRMRDSDIGKKFSMHRSDVARQIKWAAGKLGFIPWSPPRGAPPRSNQNCAKQPAR